MCGIVGIIDKDSGKDATVREMAAAIRHRGPDDDGFFSDEFAALGMRRLSVIDLKTGEQPIWSEDRAKCIFFNGEIYNYKELRAELESKGKKFSTASDTEVILAMYEAYGDKMLLRLRGMFAFCIYNILTHELFLARDFFGIKPLYYLKRGKKVAAFSSEIKSFLKYPGFKTEVNDAAAYNYLSFQYNPLPETFFKGVWKLPPGHFMKINAKDGTAEIKRYWSFEFHPEKMEEAEAARETYRAMEDSVSHHMIADVPVGSFLSGGVDSSIIATLMQKIRGDKKIKTFTVGFRGLTEGKEAAQTSDFLETDHTEITVGPEEYFGELKKITWHFDEPVADPSAVGLYFVAKEARKHVTVVLSGEGSDELFGGYNIYLEPFARKKISWIPKFILKFVISLPFEFRGKNYARRAYGRRSGWYLGNASVFKPEELPKIWKGGRENLFSVESLYKKMGSASESAKMQYVDIFTWLRGDILAKADKMTMANSLELRVPFLDLEVAKLASKLPDSLKWRGNVTKYILREAFRKVIPEETRTRKKLGFPTPIRHWLREDTPAVREVYGAILKNEYISAKLNMEAVNSLIREHKENKADNSRKIFLLLMLALWYDSFALNK